MKMLLTSDLHGCEKWYAWLLEQCGGVDLICIAGDMVDMLSGKGLLPQIQFFDDWVTKVSATGTKLAFCSGNHDCSLLAGDVGDLDGETSRLDLLRRVDDRIRTFFELRWWTDGLGRGNEAMVVVDRRNVLLDFATGERLLVTTIPYLPDDNMEQRGEVRRLWEEGARLRAEHRAAWLVLHHEPPAHVRVGGVFASASLTWQIQETPPNFVLSGHLHTRPYERDGDWRDRIGPTLCLNSGQVHPRHAEFPNHFLLDTRSGTITWRATDIRRREQVRMCAPLRE